MMMPKPEVGDAVSERMEGAVFFFSPGLTNSFPDQDVTHSQLMAERELRKLRDVAAGIPRHD